MMASAILGMHLTPSSIRGCSQSIWRQLRTLRMDDRRHGARYAIGGVQEEVRALRNREIWVEADDARDAARIIREAEKNGAKRLPLERVLQPTNTETN